MLINTAFGVGSVKKDYINVARTHELSPIRTAFTVILPAAAPTILTGMRISIGIAWLVIVAAEMLVPLSSKIPELGEVPPDRQIVPGQDDVCMGVSPKAGSGYLLGSKAPADLMPPFKDAHAHACVFAQVHGKEQGLRASADNDRVEHLIRHDGPLQIFQAKIVSCPGPCRRHAKGRKRDLTSLSGLNSPKNMDHTVQFLQKAHGLCQEENIAFPGEAHLGDCVYIY